MKTNILVALVLNFAFSSFSQIKYPRTNSVDSADKYFGSVYPDRYRWLEDLKIDSVAEWYKSQTELTSQVINKINGREELLAEWNDLDKTRQIRYKSIVKRQSRIFYKKIIPGEVAKLYYKEDKNEKEQLLFDPSEFEPAQKVTLQTAVPNPDGSKVVITLTSGGSEISRIKVLNVASKSLEKDEIFPCFSDVSFLDNHSFIYTSLKTADNTSKEFLKNNTVKIHKFGDDPENDKIYFGNESYPELKLKPENFVNGELSISCPGFVFTGVNNDDGLNIIFFAKKPEIYKEHIHWDKLCTPGDKLVNRIIFADDKVFAFTNKEESNFKLVATSLQKPDWNKPEIIATEKNGLSLNSFVVLKDYILIVYTNGINQRLFKYVFKTKKTSEIKLPFHGTMLLQEHYEEPNSVYINITSWNKPYTEYKLDVATETFINSDYNSPHKFPQKYLDTEIEEVEVKGHDGTMIPLSIIYKKGMKKDGTNICFMEGYGAYGFSYEPTFNQYLLSLVSKGVVLAIAHVRGGGEKGVVWEKGGLKTTKPNTWKDFNSCTEYLIAKGFTAPKKIICSSGSAGGILISRAITDRPDLYGVAISNAGVLNAIRGEQMPNGPNVAYQNGTTKDSVECKALYEMDGLLHVKQNTDYPAVICVSGWNDPRVSPWQSGKFVAVLQNKSKSNNLALLKINYDNGHFSNLADLADNWSFALWQCGHANFTVK